LKKSKLVEKNIIEQPATHNIELLGQPTKDPAFRKPTRVNVFLLRLFDLAAASKLRLLHRSVPPPPAGLAGVGRGGEPDLWVEILIKVVFSKD
jgi:hypothetical protein